MAMNRLKIMIALLSASCAMSLVSCGVDVVGSDYPAEKIYLPAAVTSQVYVIDSAEENAGYTPTEGAPYRFLIDYDEYTFSVPLAVYRSGTGNDGAVSVDVYMDDDVVYDLILSGDLAEDTEILPVDLRECPGRVVIQDGRSCSAFNVVIDLEYLMDRHQRGRRLAFGISVDTHDRELNEECCRLAIIIDTTIFDNI